MSKDRDTAARLVDTSMACNVDDESAREQLKCDIAQALSVARVKAMSPTVDVLRPNNHGPGALRVWERMAADPQGLANLVRARLDAARAELPNHIRLTLVAIQDAFEQDDYRSLSTICEDLQGTADVAVGRVMKTRAALQVAIGLLSDVHGHWLQEGLDGLLSTALEMRMAAFLGDRGRKS